MFQLTDKQIFKAINNQIIHCSVWPVKKADGTYNIEVTILEGPLENQELILPMTQHQLISLIKEHQAE